MVSDYDRLTDRANVHLTFELRNLIIDHLFDDLEKIPGMGSGFMSLIASMYIIL